MGGFTSIEMRLVSLIRPDDLLDSLIYLAGSQASYIHVILSYVVSITLCINQPLVRILTVDYQSISQHDIICIGMNCAMI